jgi:hypothetical protein
VHQGSERNGFHPGAPAAETSLAKMLAKNFLRFGIPIQDLPDNHVFVDPSFSLRHNILLPEPIVWIFSMRRGRSIDYFFFF